jgi:hypothetical protein
VRKLHLLAVSALALIGTAMPAQAATVVFDFGNTAGQANAGSVGGTDANGRIFTATSGSSTVRVRASGWSLDTSGVVRDSFLGIFSGAGLGVTSGDDTYNNVMGQGGTHSVDNRTRTDFIILQFDQKVKLDSGRFNAINLTGLNYTDTDATIGYGNTNLAWNAQPGLNNQNVSALNTLLPVANRYSVTGGSSSSTRPINASGFIGNVWLVSAAMAGHNTDGKFDSFKFNSLKVNTVLTVPEPESWAMMIAGFGLIGGAIRRRRATERLAHA